MKIPTVIVAYHGIVIPSLVVRSPGNIDYFGLINAVLKPLVSITYRVVYISQSQIGVEYTATATATPTGYRPTYVWQESANGSTWSDVDGATGASYTATEDPTTENAPSYRCVVTYLPETPEQDVIVTTSSPTTSRSTTPPEVTSRVSGISTSYANTTGGGEPAGIGVEIEIDYDATPTVIYTINAPYAVILSATGKYCDRYQWQHSTDGAAWSNITGATATTATITFTNADAGLHYYRCVVTGPGGSTSSNVFVFNVVSWVGEGLRTISLEVLSPGSYPLSVGDNADITSYQWQISTDGSTWTDVNGVTGARYG